MKKAISKRAKEAVEPDEMRAEYDFGKMKGGVRGKYYRSYRQGYTVTIHKADGATEVQHFKPESGVVVLDRDVRKYFPDAESVNKALRSLIELIPSKPRKVKA
jgi:hypothetical protein